MIPEASTSDCWSDSWSRTASLSGLSSCPASLRGLGVFMRRPEGGGEPLWRGREERSRQREHSELKNPDVEMNCRVLGPDRGRVGQAQGALTSPSGRGPGSCSVHEASALWSVLKTPTLTSRPLPHTCCHRHSETLQFPRAQLRPRARPLAPLCLPPGTPFLLLWLNATHPEIELRCHFL